MAGLVRGVEGRLWVTDGTAEAKLLARLAEPWIDHAPVTSAALFKVNNIDAVRPYVLGAIALVTAGAVLNSGLGYFLRPVIVAAVLLVSLGANMRARRQGLPGQFLVVLTGERVAFLVARFRSGRWTVERDLGAYPVADVKATVGKTAFNLNVELPGDPRPLRLTARWVTPDAAHISKVLTQSH